jgi:hypothetical protein
MPASAMVVAHLCIAPFPRRVAGGPPLTISMCGISTEGAPSLRFLQEPAPELVEGVGVDDACAIGFVT